MFEFIFGKKKFASLLKRASEEEKEYLNIMYSFAQGQISSDKFIQALKEKKGLSEYILADKKIPNIEWERKDFEHIVADNFQSHESKYNLYRMVQNFFLRRKIEGNYFNIEFALAKTIRENTPDHIYFGLDEVLKDMPQGLTNDEQLAWCGKRCREMCSVFQCDNKPPEWVQEPEWPKYHNRYMIFSYQEEIEEKVIYHFYDKDSGHKKEIVQYY